MIVTVYCTQTCPYCTMAKDFLAEQKIKFKEIDVGKDKKGLQEMLQKSGQSGVPVLDVNGKIIVGFDEDAIVKALKNKE